VNEELGTKVRMSSRWESKFNPSEEGLKLEFSLKIAQRLILVVQKGLVPVIKGERIWNLEDLF
jgi:hypothetical protein